MGGEALDEAASSPPILCLILIVQAMDFGRWSLREIGGKAALYESAKPV